MPNICSKYPCDEENMITITSMCYSCSQRCKCVLLSGARLKEKEAGGPGNLMGVSSVLHRLD